MATTSNADSTASGDANATDAASGKANGEATDDLSSVFDKLETAGRVVWVAFLASVVVFALIPSVALWFGAVPFDPPPTRPYFAFVGLTAVGTAALVAAGIYDV